MADPEEDFEHRSQQGYMPTDEVGLLYDYTVPKSRTVTKQLQNPERYLEVFTQDATLGFIQDDEKRRLDLASTINSGLLFGAEIYRIDMSSSQKYFARRILSTFNTSKGFEGQLIKALRGHWLIKEEKTESLSKSVNETKQEQLEKEKRSFLGFKF